MLHHFLHTARICLLLWLAWAAASCTDTADLPAEGRTATLELRIPQLEASATRAAGTMTLEQAEKAIHSLRVVVVYNKTQVINKEFTSEDLKNGSGTVTLDQVPVGQIDLYVIGNELSIDNGYTTTEDGKLLVQDLKRECFPKRGTVFLKESNGTAPIGLPMGWIRKGLVIQEGTNEIDVELERQVAKLNIRMYNTLSDPIKVVTISFGKFFSDRFYFVREGTLDVPDDTEYADISFTQVGEENNGITIAEGTTETMVCYVYPSFAWKSLATPSPYTIGFFTKAGVTYKPQPFVNSFGALNSILRNTQININATLSRSANVKIDFTVTEWTEVGIDIPPFD